MTKQGGKDTLDVSMFGGFSLSFKGEPLHLTKNVSGKMIHLLLMLLCAGDAGVHRDEILRVLYEGNDVVQASNSFRAMVFRLRKALTQSGLPDGEYITVQNGRYRWDVEHLHVRLDVDEFEQVVTRGLKESDPARQQKLLERAESLYQGEFLPAMIGEEWAAILNNRYQKLYFSCMRILMESWKANGDYGRVLRSCERILEWYPYEEWQIGKMDCLLAMKDYLAALKYYEEIVNFYQAEFGIAPPEELQKRRKILKEQMNYKIRNIGEIKVQMMSDESLGGAAYCDYMVLAEIYRYMTQVLDRIGMSAYLMLWTITDKDLMPVEKPEVLEDVRTSLKEAIGAAIRKSDIYAGYGKNQFLVLLLGTSQTGCEVVEQRIRTNFQKLNTRRKVEVCCAVGSILDVNADMIQEQYNQSSLNWNIKETLN